MAFEADEYRNPLDSFKIGYTIFLDSVEHENSIHWTLDILGQNL